MKISEKAVRYLLIFLILLSLYFSYNIWLSPSSKQVPEGDTSSVMTENQNYRKETDAFLPLRLIWTSEGQSRGTQSENVISQVQTRLTKDTSQQLNLLVAEDEEDFQNYLQPENSIELLYEGGLLLADYLEIYDFGLQDLGDVGEVRISRIQLDFDRQTVNFMDFHNHSIYQLTFSGERSEYEAIIKEKTDTLTNMTQSAVLEQGQYVTSESVALKKYSYILSTQSFTVFRNAFFQDTENVSNDNPKIYISGKERLTISGDSQNQQVEFKGELLLTPELDDIYRQSFSYIKKLGTNVGNLRYFDRSSTQVNYRVFVEGYPVFGELSRGLVSVTVGDKAANESKSIKIEASTNTIQVPIPAEEVITLPSTDVVWQQVLAAGAQADQIKSIIIGYTWQAIEGNTRVVDLIPEWYVHYDGAWYSEAELIKQLPDLEVE